MGYPYGNIDTHLRPFNKTVTGNHRPNGKGKPIYFQKMEGLHDPGVGKFFLNKIQSY